MLIKQTHWEENKHIFSKITLHERFNENKYLYEREEKHLEIIKTEIVQEFTIHVHENVERNHVWGDFNGKFGSSVRKTTDQAPISWKNNFSEISDLNLD